LYGPAPLTQLALDLPPPPPTFGNFVPGENAEALGAVRALLAPGTDAGTRFLYLWGPAGSGRTHLLRALAEASEAARRPSRMLSPSSRAEDFVFDPAVRTWLIDECDRLAAAEQVAAFHLFNAVQAEPGAVLASAGSEPPARLAVIPELSSRLGWGLVMQLRPLSDADTARAIEQTLSERGLAVGADLVPWLLTRAPRDLGSLRGLIDALDRFALQRQRAITLPLLREFLQQRLL